jgi:hypothetical protein
VGKVQSHLLVQKIQAFKKLRGVLGDEAFRPRTIAFSHVRKRPSFNIFDYNEQGVLQKIVKTKLTWVAEIT